MLSISNILAGTNGAGPALAKATAVKQRNQFSQSTVDDAPASNDSGKIIVDNTAVKDRNRLNKGSTGEFSHTFRKEITNEVPQKAKLGRKVQNQEQLFNAKGQPNVILPLLDQWSLKIKHGPEGIVKKVEPKPGLEHTQLYNNLSKDKSLVQAVTTAGPKQREPIQLVKEKQIGLLKETLPKASQASFATRTTDNEQNGEGLILKPLISAHHGITTATEKPEDVPVTNTLDSQQTPTLASEGLKPKTTVDAHSRITSVGEKAAIVSTFNASGSQKTLPLVVEELTPEALVGADSEITNVIQKPAIAGKSVVPVGQKIPLSNPNIPPVQNKPSGLQFQAVRIDPEQSPLIAENRVANKTTGGQPIRTQTQQFSGPLAEDVTEQAPNSPANLAYQHLHRAQVQVSTGPIKGRNSSVSNNNSDSGFEQILSGDNAGTYIIEEQTSAFSEAVKTDNLPTQTSPGGVSASITEQILESIQNSSSQQAATQQITIRLHPPELGKVYIKFVEQENQIIGLVEVDKTQTRYEVEQALPEIIQNLSDSGIQIKRLEVMLTDQNGQPSYGDESLQDGSFQQHHDLPEWDNSDSPGTFGANDPERVGNNSSYHDGLDPQMQITADSINILI
jgi:flagellar hook-length control protein FliK